MKAERLKVRSLVKMREGKQEPIRTFEKARIKCLGNKRLKCKLPNIGIYEIIRLENKRFKIEI